MATTERSVVMGVFADRAAAEQAIRELQQAGFSNEQIKYSVNRSEAGILDGLVGMGLSYSEASFYNNEFHSGHTVVAVRTNDRQKDAYNILRLGGAYDASTRSGGGTQQIADNNQTLQVHEEVLQTQKQWVQTEEIRIRKRVITEEKVFRVPVSREEVIIERVPLNLNGQPSTHAPAEQNYSIGADEGRIVNLADGETFKIAVSEEQVTFQKIPMVVEEITLTKRVVQETKQITAAVQREKVRLERQGNAHIQGNNIGDIPIQSPQKE